MATTGGTPTQSTDTATAQGAPRTWQTGLVSIGIALAGNLAVLGAARLAGADMTVRFNDTATETTIGVGSVALMTIGPTLLATIALFALRLRGARAWRALAAAGLVVGLVTAPAPFTVLADADTRIGLALMHVLTGVVWFGVVRRAAVRGEV